MNCTVTQQNKSKHIIFWLMDYWNKLNMALSKLEANTHNFRNTIISFKSEIRATDVETYLKRHLSEFYKNSRFIVLCGVHTWPTGELAQSETKFLADYQSMFDNVISDHENQCRKKCNTCRECQKFLLRNEKKFHMGTVMPIFSKLNQDGKYVLLKSSINTIVGNNIISSHSCYLVVFRIFSSLWRPILLKLFWTQCSRQ